MTGRADVKNLESFGGESPGQRQHLLPHISHPRKHLVHAHTRTLAVDKLLQLAAECGIPTPDSQGLEFLQRGVRCEDVKEADHLRGREEAKTLRGALRPETRGKVER